MAATLSSSEAISAALDVDVVSMTSTWGKFKVIGIAKKDESKGEDMDKIILPGRSNPINLSKDRDVLFFLQRIRDESHRFAITFHRKRRGKSQIVSSLDGIEGVGPKRKKALLKYFGSVEKIKKATMDELSVIPEMNQKVSENLFKHFRQSENN